MTKYICNAFSLQMVKPSRYNLEVKPITSTEFEAATYTIESAVGHPDTARVLGVDCNRINVSLDFGDTVIVAQLQGGRLPEGAKTLPEGFSFKYYIVTVLDPR